MVHACSVVYNPVSPWSVAWQALLSMRLPRQEHWSGLHFPSPGDPPSPGIYSRLLCLLHLQITTVSPGEPRHDTVQSSSILQACPALWPLDCSTPGLPVHHQLPQLTQTPVHRVSDAIQPSHPLSSPSPPAVNLSQHQGLFQRVCSSHQVAKVLELQLRISPSNEYSGLISFRMDWLDLLVVQGTLKSHPPTLQFKSINSLMLNFLYSPILTSKHDFWKNHSFD